jgi:hypothetical protein
MFGKSFEIARKAIRPMRPKPLIPTFKVMGILLRRVGKERFEWRVTRREGQVREQALCLDTRPSIPVT